VRSASIGAFWPHSRSISCKRERADQLLDEGDMAGAETWHRILNAIERLQAKAPPAEGEKVH
jgi:hypothetical protein